MKDIVIIGGSTHPDLAKKIAQFLGVTLGKITVGKFSNGETAVTVEESVRAKDVFIIQPTVTNPNDALMELLIIIDTVKRGSATRITACMPCIGYARQDKKESSRSPISAKLIANMLQVAGVDRILTVDLHTNQMQGFFDVPVDNLYTDNYLSYYIQNYISGDKVIVSPGVSSTIRSKRFADALELPLCIVHFGKLHPGKTREEVATSEDMKIVGDVKEKVTILVTDLADTLAMECVMAESLIANGAKQVFAVATHGLLSDGAVQRLNESKYLTELVITNTVEHFSKQKLSKKLKVIDITPLIAESIRRTHYGDSISSVFTREIFELSLVSPSENHHSVHHY